MVSPALRRMFILHFFADSLFALPLLIAPAYTLSLFGLAGEPVLARLIGAALIGIGGASMIERNSSTDAYHAMLTLKLLWSGTATLGLLFSAVTTPLWSLWLFTAIFFGFFCIWALFKYALS